MFLGWPHNPTLRPEPGGMLWVTLGHVEPCVECGRVPLLRAGRVARADKHKLDCSFHLAQLP